ncbi:hypothetical protein B0H13DRAFT_1953685 [Mycena leptocephala]|nr:hypothetical protein B0H13DRAFT_1953685 [Mycena leptocephala]
MPGVCSKILGTRQIDQRWRKWNESHDVIERQTACTFVVETLTNTWTILASTQVRLFIEHNLRLYGENPPSGPGPFSYDAFASIMNDHNHSGFVWAYWDFDEQRVRFPPKGGKVATPKSWLLRDHELSDNLAPPGMRLVEATFYDTLVVAAAQRQAKAQQSQLERQIGKHAREDEGDYDVPSLDETRRRAQQADSEYQVRKDKGKSDRPSKKSRTSNESSNAIAGPSGAVSAASPATQLASQINHAFSNGLSDGPSGTTAEGKSGEGDDDAEGEDDETMDSTQQ